MSVVLKHGPATFLRERDRVSGTLVIEGRLLWFRPDHPGADQRAEKFEIVDIKRVRRAWRAPGRALPVAPNAVEITMRNDQTYAFVVDSRKAWIETLTTAQAETPKG